MGWLLVKLLLKRGRNGRTDPTVPLRRLDGIKEGCREEGESWFQKSMQESGAAEEQQEKEGAATSNWRDCRRRWRHKRLDKQRRKQ